MHICVTADIERFSDAITKYNQYYTIDDLTVTRTLLDTFCDLDIPSTLFVLGLYAEEEPGILDMIRENGHEVASHGYTHVDLRTLPDSAVEKEVKACCDLVPAKGFRAPYYGLNKTIIKYVEPHFVYDSSQVPVRNTNRMDKFLNIYMVTDSLMEIPISTVGILPLTSMVLRLCPLPFMEVLALMVLKRDGYLVINVHPWEFFDIPYVKVPFYVTKNTGLSFLKKVSAFISFLKSLDAEFMTMEQVYEHYRC